MIVSLRRGLIAALLLSGTVAAQDDAAGHDSIEDWRAAHVRTSGDAMKPCPPPCQEEPSSESEKASFLFSDAAGLAACNETMVLSLAVQNSNIDGAPRPVAIRACKAEFTSRYDTFTPKEDVAAICSTPNHRIVQASVSMGELSSPNGNNKFVTVHLLEAGKQLLNSLGAKKPSCTDNFLSFGYSQSSVIGLFGGLELHQHGVPAEVMNKFLEHAREKSISMSTLVQLCNEGERGPTMPSVSLPSVLRTFLWPKTRSRHGQMDVVSRLTPTTIQAGRPSLSASQKTPETPETPPALNHHRRSLILEMLPISGESRVLPRGPPARRKRSKRTTATPRWPSDAALARLI
ncbi:uncharacterized protein TrAFT101_009463 [Trichoderma asperellum]|uniref:uncharacterized protein n=1 Tax=Trichoderma asperellum TaxID=101201 RepID=UPI0033345D0D|nr:hypothetical protein TrAFT101_009463 [Trichoderma asperellum]